MPKMAYFEPFSDHSPISMVFWRFTLYFYD